MKPPLLLRPLSESEQVALNLGLRSPDAFILRRCQILKASAAGRKPAQIAGVIGCASQTVRNAIHDERTAWISCPPASIFSTKNSSTDF